MEDALVWKKIFEEVRETGKDYTKYENRSLFQTFEESEHRFSSWAGEDGLLQCFHSPSSEVLQSVGYKRAAGCLLGKSCKFCKTMAAKANPFTFERE